MRQSYPARLRAHHRDVPWRRRTILSLLLLGLAASVPGVVVAQVDCADCHEEAIAEGSVHVGFGCADCHTDIEDYPHAEDRLAGDAICGQCHEAGDQLATSVHADPESIGDLTCMSCHGAAHAVLPPTDPSSPASPIGQISSCGGCHENREGLIDSYLVSVHGRALVRSGLVNAAPSCSDCHGSHHILPPGDPESSVSHQQAPRTCGQCHQAILGVWADQSAHGAAWKAGDNAGPVCIDCHSSHRVQRPYERAQRLASPETCGNCHQGRFSTFRDTFHGQVTDLGFVTAAICSDCHTAHENLPASDPRSSVNQANLAATCGKCHGEVSASFLTFEPHQDPSKEGQHPLLHLSWLFMTSLLISVFAFFGLHDALWLQRSLVALSRGEVSRSVPRREGQWVRRFRRSQVLTHVTVIITFLVLAATGLPLKFHFTHWAQALASVPGGVGVTRLFHRTAAIVTFGYFFFHLANIFRHALIKGDTGFFWGWRSMVPQPRDFRELLVNLRYFLYLGPRPRYDRWTYWEKFDYLAVFWGVAIIGTSGLMLWLPQLFSTFLPGWTLNLAHLVHSDEALLAVGFIFVFHFFHTHLRPETMPLDPVVFVGSMPLERFQEERPAEYKRLVDRGELEDRLVDPPSKGQMRRAYVWGLTAVAVGIALVVGIIWGLVSGGHA